MLCQREGLSPLSFGELIEDSKLAHRVSKQGSTANPEFLELFTSWIRTAEHRCAKKLFGCPRGWAAQFGSLHRF